MIKPAATNTATMPITTIATGGNANFRDLILVLDFVSLVDGGVVAFVAFLG
jgi:hypothetical protein